MGRLVFLLLAAGVLFKLSGSPAQAHHGQHATRGRQPSANATAQRQVTQGRQSFRFDTFEDQAFWGTTLGLHKAIEGANLGGVGPGVSPTTALAVGLKVDADALPAALKQAIAHGKVNLDDPATTLALLKLRAVVGVTGFFTPQGTLRSVGIQCALCHSTVDDSFAPGIGHRLDGWANRDLNVGAIVALSPNLQPVATLLGTNVATVRRVLAAWGPGKFDAELLLDGKAFQPNGRSAATLIPPAYGLARGEPAHLDRLGLHPLLERLCRQPGNARPGQLLRPPPGRPHQFPVAARNRFGHLRAARDLITAKLPALHAYQLALAAPTPPTGSFDAAAAARGKRLFSGKAECSTCHVPPLFTEPGWNLHTGAQLGIDNFQADRSPTHAYRTSPLKGLWAHQKGGFTTTAASTPSTTWSTTTTASSTWA